MTLYRLSYEAKTWWTRVELNHIVLFAKEALFQLSYRPTSNLEGKEEVESSKT